MTASFGALLDQAIATRTSDHPVWRYNDKLAGRELAALADVRAPALLSGPCSLERLRPPDGPFVLKPVHGCSANGVFPLLPDGDGYRDLLRRRNRTWREVKASAYGAKKRHNRIAGHPDAIRNPWILEELVLRDGDRLAYDWKAFVVGGRVHAVRQCDRTATTVDIRWYDRDWHDVGDIMPTPKWNYNTAMSPPQHPDALTAAFERVARHVASPFVRVDLYEDDNGPVFGEITPHPSGGKTWFVEEWDRRLGEAWTSCTSSDPVTTTSHSGTASAR